MRQDLDRLMKARNLDGILVSGQIHGNPAMYYMANGAGLTQATIVKKIGESPVLIAAPMEREEAKAAGLPIELTTRYNFMGLLKKHKGDMLAAKVEYTQKILEAHHIKGRVGFYGMMEQGSAYAFLKAFHEASPDIEVVGEYDNDLLSEARTTKDKAEAERIRQMGQRTIAVVKDT
ncbi:MAG: hypothetical protein JW981_02115, partial [Anaerolineae bacterium]|nr:hypothetical protein [Anaerolineae bacterium]